MKTEVFVICIGILIAIMLASGGLVLRGHQSITHTDNSSSQVFTGSVYTQAVGR